jgi:hypothetical protein
MQDLPVICKVAVRVAPCAGRTDVDGGHVPVAVDPAQPNAGRVGVLGPPRDTA